MKKMKFRINSISLLTGVLIIAVIILLNIFTGMLTERFFLRADLTDSGIYTLSDRADEYLQTVSESVDIVVLAEESTWRANTMYSQAIRVLENYTAQTNGKIRVQYVNPDLNTFDGPLYGNALSVLRDSHTELEGMERGDIIFISSRRATKIPAGDLFTFEYNQSTGRYVTSGINADQALISSLMYVLNESIARAVFITNHQENTAEVIKGVFERSGYVSSDMNLAVDEIPDDALIVVSAGPKNDFLSDEIVKLEQYLARGGSVMTLYDFSVTSLPVLDGFLEQWGIAIENKLIFDEENTYIPQLGVIGAHVVAGAMPFTADAESMSMSALPLGIYRPRPLRAMWVGEASGGISLLPLVQTFSAASYAKDLSEGAATTWEREDTDESGPFTLAYNARRLTRNPEGNQVFANLIVAGADIFDDGFLSMYGNAFFNLYLIAGVANDLNPFGTGVYIPPKALFGSSMPVSSAGARSVLIFMVIGLPLAVVATGVVVWRKRRNL